VDLHSGNVPHYRIAIPWLKRLEGQPVISHRVIDILVEETQSRVCLEDQGLSLFAKKIDPSKTGLKEG
jgi:hypothetical protein